MCSTICVLREAAFYRGAIHRKKRANVRFLGGRVPSLSATRTVYAKLRPPTPRFARGRYPWPTIDCKVTLIFEGVAVSQSSDLRGISHFVRGRTLRLGRKLAARPNKLTYIDSHL